jgi:hypothetical protein
MRRIRWSVLAALLSVCIPSFGVISLPTARVEAFRASAARGDSQSQTAPVPALADVLSRAGQYVLDFEDRFAVVIGDERYDQHVERGYRRTQRHDRKIKSEMMFVWLPNEQAWLAVRTVLTVDGRSISNSQKRLGRMLDGRASIGVPHLRQLRNEGARFNLGSIRRNFNDPMTPLRFLEPESQPRFEFALAGEETINGEPASKVTFNEQSQPTFIQGEHPSHGMMWIVSDGTVVRTRFEVANAKDGLTAVITVNYGRNSKLDMMVPMNMHESYSGLKGIPEWVECEATYTNFRRFETSGRIVPN